MPEKVYAYTDGACRGNPGPGGWGVLLKYAEREKELYGGERQTTNNRMELTAAIQALESLTRRCEVDWKWVKGHAGHVENERADRLANKGVDEILSVGK